VEGKRTALFWIWLMMFVAYLDRINVAVAGPTIMKALHIDHAQFGYVLSAFTFGYALMQIPGGILADRLGARRLLVAALVIWSIFTACTGLAWSLVSLVVIRILFGVGEGIENGAQFKLIGDYFDSRERSSANALFLTALALGPAFGSPMTTKLIAAAGWRGVFYAFAALGLIVAALMYFFLPKPGRDIVHTEVAADGDGKLDWTAVLRRPPTWLVFGTYLFFNVAFWGFLGWMPAYLSDSRHIKLAALGFAASIPYLCGFAGMIALGWLGARPLFHYRAAVIAAGYVAAAAFLYIAFKAAGVTPCLVGLSVAGFFLYGGFGPFWAVALDLIPDDLRGALTGFVNFGGQIGGFVAPIVMGHIVEASKSYTGGFLFMIGALILAAICLIALQMLGHKPERG
jgi:sugar phosphate permease